MGKAEKLDLIIGPEVFGASAFQSFFGTDTTALEALLSTRVEEKLRTAWRSASSSALGWASTRTLERPRDEILLAFEVFDHSVDRDHDGIPDTKDACPDVPGANERPEDDGLSDEVAGSPRAGRT